MSTSVLDPSAWFAKNLAFKNCFENHTKKPCRNFAYSCLETVGRVDLGQRTVLDVGTGEGWQTLILASMGLPREILAIDSAQGEGSSKDCLAVRSSNMNGLRRQCPPRLKLRRDTCPAINTPHVYHSRKDLPEF